MSNSASDRRRAREEYYRDNSAPGTSDERSNHNLASSLSSTNSNSVTSSHNGVLSHVTEGTRESSTRNSHSGYSSGKSRGDTVDGSYRSGSRGSGGSAMSSDPPEVGGDHYYRHVGRSPPEDDEEELRSLATTDTTAYRRLREQRKLQSKKEKAKGSDTESKRHKRSSTMRHRSQQRSDPRGNHPRDKGVRYRGSGHGRNSFDEDDYTDGGSNDSTSWISEEASRFSHATHRSSRSHSSSSITSHQWQMIVIFALGLVLIIKAGVVEVKLEQTQLRGIGERALRGGGDKYSHLDHLSGKDYYQTPTVMNVRSLVEEDESDAVEEDSPSEAYFKEAVEKLEKNGGGLDTEGEEQETEEGEENEQIEQDLEEAADEGEGDLKENYSTGEQQQPLPDLQQQQLPDQSQTQLVGGYPVQQQNFQQSFQGGYQQSGEQIQQSQQQSQIIRQQQQPPYQQSQSGYQPNQFGQHLLPGQHQYGQQQPQYGQPQNQFGQEQNQFGQQISQQNYQQYGQQPEQTLPQQYQQPPQYSQQQQYDPQQNVQAPQQFEPQLRQDVQQQVFAVQSSDEVASPPDQIGNVGSEYLNANSYEAANAPEYAPVGNLGAIEAANTDHNNGQYGAEARLQQQQLEPQLQQDVHQYVQQQASGVQSNNGQSGAETQLQQQFEQPQPKQEVHQYAQLQAFGVQSSNGQSGAETQLQQQFEQPQPQQDVHQYVQQQAFGLQSSNEVASPSDQIGNDLSNAHLNVNSNEATNAPEYAPVGNLGAIEAANTDQNNGQYGAEAQLQQQQLEPQPQQDVHQYVQQQAFGIQSSNEAASLPDQSREYLTANSNEAADAPEYAPVGNLGAIEATNADPNDGQSDVKIEKNLEALDSAALNPPTDILNNRIVPFDVSSQPRFRGNNKRDDDEDEDTEEVDEDVQDIPVQVEPDAYGTLKEGKPERKDARAHVPRSREPKPDPSNPDFNYKAAVVDDGIANTNPRLWGAKTLTTPGLRKHLNKNDAKFASAAD